MNTNYKTIIPDWINCYHLSLDQLSHVKEKSLPEIHSLAKRVTIDAETAKTFQISRLGLFFLNHLRSVYLFFCTKRCHEIALFILRSYLKEKENEFSLHIQESLKADYLALDKTEDYWISEQEITDLMRNSQRPVFVLSSSIVRREILKHLQSKITDLNFPEGLNKALRLERNWVDLSIEELSAIREWGLTFQMVKRVGAVFNVTKTTLDSFDYTQITPDELITKISQSPSSKSLRPSSRYDYKPVELPPSSLTQLPTVSKKLMGERREELINRLASSLSKYLGKSEFKIRNLLNNWASACQTFLEQVNAAVVDTGFSETPHYAKLKWENYIQEIDQALQQARERLPGYDQSKFKLLENAPQLVDLYKKHFPFLSLSWLKEFFKRHADTEIAKHSVTISPETLKDLPSPLNQVFSSFAALCPVLAERVFYSCDKHLQLLVSSAEHRQNTLDYLEYNLGKEDSVLIQGGLFLANYSETLTRKAIKALLVPDYNTYVFHHVVPSIAGFDKANLDSMLTDQAIRDGIATVISKNSALDAQQLRRAGELMIRLRKPAETFDKVNKEMYSELILALLDKWFSKHQLTPIVHAKRKQKAFLQASLQFINKLNKNESKFNFEKESQPVIKTYREFCEAISFAVRTHILEIEKDPIENELLETFHQLISQLSLNPQESRIDQLWKGVLAPAFNRFLGMDQLFT
jgi:hypothetical protein